MFMTHEVSILHMKKLLLNRAQVTFENHPEDQDQYTGSKKQQQNKNKKTHTTKKNPKCSLKSRRKNAVQLITI